MSSFERLPHWEHDILGRGSRGADRTAGVVCLRGAQHFEDQSQPQASNPQPQNHRPPSELEVTPRSMNRITDELINRRTVFTAAATSRARRNWSIAVRS